jgi:hypothetical protein
MWEDFSVEEEEDAHCSCWQFGSDRCCYCDKEREMKLEEDSSERTNESE